MSDFTSEGSSYAAEQFPPTAPNYRQQSNGGRFGEYVMPGVQSGRRPPLLHGEVSERGTRAGQEQQGITDNTTRSNAALQGSVNDRQLRADVSDDVGVPTQCLRIEDLTSNRNVFYSPLTGGVYHNVLIKESDRAVIEKAWQDKARGIVNRDQVNLYNDTGHIIQPVLAGAVGGLFSVDYKVSTVVLNLFESPNPYYGHKGARSNDKFSQAIPDGLKQKYNKCKPLIQQLLRSLR